MAANIPTAPINRATAEMSALLTKLISKQVVATLRTGRGWLPPMGITYDAYKNGTNDTYVHGSYSDLPLTDPDLSDYVLVEGVTPSTPEAFPSDVNEFSTIEHARIVTYTDEQIRTNPHNFAGVIADKVNNAALDLIDKAAGNIWMGYAAAGVPTFNPSATTAAIDTPSIVKAVTTLEMLGVSRLGGACYGCLIRPDVAATLMLEAGEKGWTDASKYAGPERLLTGELGQYRGVRFFSLPRIPAAVAVVPTFFFGLESLVFADLGSLRVSSVAPTPTISDPLAQRGAAGFRVRTGGMYLHDLVPGTDTPRLRVVVCESTPTVTVAA